jgi:hypothetical protein
MAKQKPAPDYELVVAKLKYLYNVFRSAGLERKYYAARLTRHTNTLWTLELILAVGTSSAVAGWGIWKLADGPELLWSFLGGLCTLIAVTKPVFRFPDQIQKYSKLWGGLNDFYFDVSALVDQVATTHQYTPEMEKRLKAAEDRVRKLSSLYDPSPSQKFRLKCQNEVEKEIPVDTLWLPSPPKSPEEEEKK